MLKKLKQFFQKIKDVKPVPIVDKTPKNVSTVQNKKDKAFKVKEPQIINDNKEYNAELLIFQKALDLTDEWVIDNIEFINKELHIYLSFARGTKWKIDDETIGVAYDTAPRTWRHLNFFEYRAFIHANVPRVKDKNGKPKTVDVPWANSKVGFTLKFELMILAFVKNMSPFSVGKRFGLDNHTVFKIVQRYIDKELSKQDLSLIKRFAIDEKHIGSNKYIAPVIDQGENKVIFIANGKDSSTLSQFKDYFLSKMGLIGNIILVTSDMADAFAKGIKLCFKTAKHIVDIFHVVKLFNETLNKIKNMEMIEATVLKGSKYALLKNEENLTDNQKEKLNEILDNEMLNTVKVYKLKEELSILINDNKTTPDEARVVLNSIIERGLALNIKLLNTTCKTIKKNLDKIVGYFEERYTNAISESINSKIDALISRGRGYRNTENLKTMIYFTCGKLDLDTSFTF